MTESFPLRTQYRPEQSRKTTGARKVMIKCRPCKSLVNAFRLSRHSRVATCPKRRPLCIVQTSTHLLARSPERPPTLGTKSARFARRTKASLLCCILSISKFVVLQADEPCRPILSFQSFDLLLVYIGVTQIVRRAHRGVIVIGWVADPRRSRCRRCESGI